jgi:LemA protein
MIALGAAAITLIVLGALTLLIVLWAIGAYNGLVRLRNEVKNAWAQIDVQLKRRYDLIPNLVETVKGYAAHEKETLDRVIQARSHAMSTTDVAAKGAAEAALGQALVRVLALAEQYPDLKANANFMALQEELSSTENKIAFARQYYNDSVMRYNTQIQSIPTNIIAGMGGFRPESLFEIGGVEREAPRVTFS